MEGQLTQVQQTKEAVCWRAEALGLPVGPPVPRYLRQRRTRGPAAPAGPLPAADDVTEGYIRPSIEHLRGCVEQVAAFLLERMDAEE